MTSDFEPKPPPSRAWIFNNCTLSPLIYLCLIFMNLLHMSTWHNVQSLQQMLQLLLKYLSSSSPALQSRCTGPTYGVRNFLPSKCGGDLGLDIDVNDWQSLIKPFQRQEGFDATVFFHSEHSVAFLLDSGSQPTWKLKSFLTTFAELPQWISPDPRGLPFSLCQLVTVAAARRVT